MKLLTYEKDNIKSLGVLTSDGLGIVPLSEARECLKDADMVHFIAGCDEETMEAIAEAKAAAEEAGTAIPCDSVKVLSPIERPIHDVMCVGVNYLDHREEGEAQGDDFSEQTASVYFSKRAVKIIGPGEAIVSNPDLDPWLDYEVELAVIIGKEGKDIKEEDAEDYIFGYSVFNDVSSRQLQSKHDQWYRGKSLDTYTAMGPVILTKDELPFPVEVDIISSVNGEERQHSNTRMLLNGIAGVIRDLSQATTLEPGDIIATGTCAGVAMAMDPPAYMKAGDEVTCEIPEIGKLTNPVK